jgi:hypothetical protein
MEQSDFSVIASVLCEAIFHYELFPKQIASSFLLAMTRRHCNLPFPSLYSPLSAIACWQTGNRELSVVKISPTAIPSNKPIFTGESTELSSLFKTLEKF